MKRLGFYIVAIMLLAVSFVSAGTVSRNYQSLTTATVVSIDSAFTTAGGVRAQQLLATVETAAIRYTVNGATPTTTAGGAVGHLVQSGSIIIVDSWSDIVHFKCINAVAGSGAVVKVTIGY
jgi:hypothetical protein